MHLTILKSNRERKISETHLFYNKCWEIYKAMKLLKYPVVETYIDLDYYGFKPVIVLAYKGKLEHPLFDAILECAKSP
jgi:hypothetical protein